jgi:hypothetical protein
VITTFNLFQSTSSISFSLSSFNPTWQTMPVTVSPSVLSFATAASTFFCFLLLTTTCAPSEASRLATANPILKTKMVIQINADKS